MQGGGINLDAIIQRLLKSGSKPCNLTVSEIETLCSQSKEVFMSQPMFLELKAPIKVGGDIHGQFLDLIRLFEMSGYPGQTNYLFLGNYVDLGIKSIQCMCLMLAYKLKYPENFFMLRGNHESESVSRIYGFYDECKKRYSVKVWKMFLRVFNVMPVCALIQEKILCMHGGLSPQLSNLQQIRSISRPVEIPECGLLCDLVWSDPQKHQKGWESNPRDISYVFGADVVTKFLQDHDLDLICRSHQLVDDGYQFFAGKKLVTIFSAPNHVGQFMNSAAIMAVDESLMCRMQVLRPREKKE